MAIRRALVALAAVVLLFPAALRSPADEANVALDLMVHEWGTFTTIADDDGRALPWSPFEAPTDLPSFVYRALPKTAGPRGWTVRMETPVLYFYSEAARSVSVRVAFPRGRITEWYPRGKLGAQSGVSWSADLLPGAQPPLPREPPPSHYYPARETDATPLRARPGGQYERFLFYRGVGDFALPLSARLTSDGVLLKAAAGHAPGTVLLVEARGGELAFSSHEVEQSELLVSRPLGGGVAGLERTLEDILTAAGLYPREAEAMIASWRDSWFEEGCRVFYVVPRELTDAILPLAVDPEPADTVRVLVGRIELVTPEREEALLERVRALDAAGLGPGGLATLGRFAPTILRRVLKKNHDPVVSARLRKLLAED